MRRILPVNKIPHTLLISIKTKKPQQIVILAKDRRKPNTIFYNRKGVVRGKRTFELKLPIAPKALDLIIYNKKTGLLIQNNDPTFRVTYADARPLKTNPIFMSDRDREFLDFAKWFSENAGILSAGKFKPSCYISNNGNFTIAYYDVILDRKTRIELKTPARIGHTTGVIEVSKEDFLKYTVPMRLIILLHEYSHKYMNPEIGRDISDEVSADINALRIYLSEGFSEIEAMYVFAKVFQNTDTPQNRKRFFILSDFIRKFNAGEFGNVKTSYVDNNIESLIK